MLNNKYAVNVTFPIIRQAMRNLGIGKRQLLKNPEEFEKLDKTDAMFGVKRQFYIEMRENFVQQIVQECKRIRKQRAMMTIFKSQSSKDKEAALKVVQDMQEAEDKEFKMELNRKVTNYVSQLNSQSDLFNSIQQKEVKSNENKKKIDSQEHFIRKLQEQQKQQRHLLNVQKLQEEYEKNQEILNSKLENNSSQHSQSISSTSVSNYSQKPPKPITISRSEEQYIQQALYKYEQKLRRSEILHSNNLKLIQDKARRSLVANLNRQQRVEEMQELESNMRKLQLLDKFKRANQQRDYNESLRKRHNKSDLSQSRIDVTSNSSHSSFYKALSSSTLYITEIPETSFRRRNASQTLKVIQKQQEAQSQKEKREMHRYRVKINRVIHNRIQTRRRIEQFEKQQKDLKRYEEHKKINQGLSEYTRDLAIKRMIKKERVWKRMEQLSRSNQKLTPELILKSEVQQHTMQYKSNYSVYLNYKSSSSI